MRTTSTYQQKSLPPSYNHICCTLSAASKFTGKPLTSEILVAALHEKWDEEVASKATVENVVMSAQWQNKGKGQSSGGKSKKKPDRSHLKCMNLVCGKTGHLIADCWCKGGGKVGQSPALKKNKAKGKEKVKELASAAIDKSDDEHVIAVVADDNDDSNVALMCTSDYKAKGNAHVARGEEVTAIADCRALKTYSPKHWRFKNYTNIDLKPIKAMNGEVFYAVGKGDLQLSLPMGKDEKPTITRFQNAYHAPKMAYTLISLSHISYTGFPIHIEPTDCTMYICTP